MKRLVFHGSVVLHHLFVSYFYLNHVDFSNTNEDYLLNMHKFRFRFLTGWNFKAQSVYFIICLAEDLVGLTSCSLETKQTIRKFKSFFFTSCVFPLSMFVTLMFWGLFAVDRELVYPSVVEGVLPSWLNHAFHTNITVVIMLEMFLSYHWYNKRKFTVIVLNSFLIAYNCCLLLTYLMHGYWLYPVLGSMDWSQRILFYVVTHLLVMAAYMVGEGLHSIIWVKKIRRKQLQVQLQLQKEGKSISTVVGS